MKSDLWDSDLLKAERKRRGWSQAKLAQALGVDVTTVRRWEGRRAIPYPYHRSKMFALFAESPGELERLSDADEESGAPSTGPLGTAAEVPLLADTSAITDTLGTANSLPGCDELLKPKQFLSPRSLWRVDLGCIKHVTMFRSLNRLSWHSFSIISTILLAILLIVRVLLTITGLPLPGISSGSLPISTPEASTTYGPPLYHLRFSNTDPSAQRVQHVFNAVYAQLVNRFALDPASVDKNIVTLTFSDLASSVQTSGRTITVNPHWIEQHPTQMGLLTHKLTLVVEQYPSGAPAWFADGLADYARSVYGPADDDWSLPDGVQSQQSYQQGGAVAARFLLWLELHTRSDIVDQLNHALQKGQSFSVVFRRLTHATVDDLWSQYQAQSDITPTPEQRYTIATSRKPLYRSSHQALSGAENSDYIQGSYLSNFTMQADITIVAGDAGAGFFFRSNDTNDYEVYLFANGDYLLSRLHQSQYQSEPLTFSSAIKVGLNQTNRLTIIVQKYSMYLYINGQFITKVDNIRLLSSGSLGVIFSQYTHNIMPDVQFDNLQVF